MLSIVDILGKLEMQLGAEQAQLQLAASLERLQLPVRSHYTAEEVMAIAASIIDSQRKVLRDSTVSEAQALEAAIAPLIDSVLEP